MPPAPKSMLKEGGGERSREGEMRPGKADLRRAAEILGLDPSSSLGDVKTAFRRAALESHPDRGGDAAEFRSQAQVIRLTSYRELNAAYDAIDADPSEFRAP